MKPILLILVFFSCSAVGQLSFNIYSSTSGEQSLYNKIKHDIKWPDEVQDSLSGVKECALLLPKLFSEGYLSASVDTIYIKDSVFNAGLHIGGEYKWADLRSGIQAGILNEAGVRLSIIRSKAASPAAISSMVRKLLKWYNDNGYPFARIYLDSVQIMSSRLSASLMAEQGELILFDSLIVKGNSRVAYAYISNYLALKKDEPYNETRLSGISSKLRELPFVNEVRRLEVEFSDNKARVIIYIDDKKASQFSGIIGLLPDNDNPGKVNVTGDLQLRLLSAFGHAELFDLNWSNPLPKSQDLQVRLNYPFLFDTPLGLDASLKLFKKDSTFLEFNRELGVQHFFRGNDYVKAFAGIMTSDLISVKGYENATSLPPFADVRVTTYGLGWRYERLDYRLNPRRGFVIEGQGGIGNKIITRNSRINPEVYDSIDLKTTHYSGKGAADIYFPLFARSVINIGTSGAWLLSPDIFENELYRFGGLKTLRGFDESSINASQYIIGKMEYRYILEQNSFLFLFGNVAYYENRSRNKFIHDTPYGYGAGLTFETKLGIFSFTYALGKQFDNPVLLRNGKVHFGILNFF